MSIYRILVTGSRNYPDDGTVESWLTSAVEHALTMGKQPVIVHGACPTGADMIADHFAVANRIAVERHPADWSRGRIAGPLRNQQMVDRGASICIAFPFGESRGTRGCARFAEQVGIKVVMVAEPTT